jgi:hypothetical protein
MMRNRNAIRIGIASPEYVHQGKDEGRNDKNTAFIRTFSLNCDDRADIMIVAPDNKRESVLRPY